MHRPSSSMGAGLCAGMAVSSLSDAGNGNCLSEQPGSQDGSRMGAWVPLPWRLKHIRSPTGALNRAKSCVEADGGHSDSGILLIGELRGVKTTGFLQCLEKQHS